MDKNNQQIPYLINFHQTGHKGVGYISVSEVEHDVPFVIQRIFWVYQTPEKIVRGNHANLTNEEVIVAVQGEIKITTVNPAGEKLIFVLDNPNQGLYLPPNVWLTLEYTEQAVQLVFSSEKYEDKNYIRNYQEFTS